MAINPEYFPSIKRPIDQAGNLIDIMWYQWLRLLTGQVSEEDSVSNYFPDASSLLTHELHKKIKDLEALFHMQNNNHKHSLFKQDVTSSRDVDTVYLNNSNKIRFCIVTVKMSA